MASSGSGPPSLEARIGNEPPTSMVGLSQDTLLNVRSSDEYNCQLIAHLPMGYNAGQVNRLLQVQCPASENDFVQVELVAAHPSASGTAPHESYAVVTSSRSGAELKQVEPNAGLGSYPVITLFKETLIAKFSVCNVTDQNLAMIAKQAHLLQLAKCNIIERTEQKTVLEIAGACSQIQSFREYLVKLLLQSAFLLSGKDTMAPQGIENQPVKEVTCMADITMDTTPSTESKSAGQSFGGFSPEVLHLMPKLPNGNIAGVQYLPNEGRVCITCASKEEEDACISQFQSVYQNIVQSRQLKTITIQIPPTFLEEDLQPLLDKFNDQYNQCHFQADVDNKNIRVISVSSRQFDQAKKLLTDSLHSKEAGATASITGTCEVIQLPKGRKLTLKKADLACEKVDVIVNAANGQLMHAGGVAYALDKASNGELQRHSRKYTQQHGDVPVGGACVTKGGGSLKCKYVIHAVGPMASTHSTDLLRAEVIFSAVSRSLVEAQKLRAVSIAFPAISSGMFGIKSEVSAEAILHAILTYKYPEDKKILSDIRIVIIDHPTHACFASMMARKRAEMEKEKMATELEQSVLVSTAAGPTGAIPGPTTSFGQGYNQSGTNSGVFNVADLMKNTVVSQSTSGSVTSPLVGMNPTTTSPFMASGGNSSSLLTTQSSVLLAPCKFTQTVSSYTTPSVTTTPTSAALALPHNISTPATISSASAHGKPSFSTVVSTGTGVTSTTPSFAAIAGGSSKSHGNASSAAASEKNGCPICMEEKPVNPVKMPCCHQVLCKNCRDQALRASPLCAICRKPQRAVVGNQPPGTMSHTITKFHSLSGYEGHGMITITYVIPDGVQTRDHPNPGKRYHGTMRTAYLPDTIEGREVLHLLQRAFDARLIFTVGTSHTSGMSNVVTWNDIHHKTSTLGGVYGYPDPTYLARVKQELKDKGIS